MREINYGRNLISGYAPNTFLKPVILISTIFGGKGEERSTAICFGNALNRFHLMEKVFVSKKCYERAGWGDPRPKSGIEAVSEFIVIKKHKNWNDAKAYHMKLMDSLCWEKYLEMYDKYCKEQHKKFVIALRKALKQSCNKEFKP